MKTAPHQEPQPARKRRHRDRLAVLRDGCVEASCWCDTATVWIPPEWVGERTETCGRPNCEPPT